MNSLRRRLSIATLALCAFVLPSCATYVADGCYGGAYNAGYCAPASTIYVAPRTYCAPAYYASSYYTPSYYGGSCYTPRTYCAPAYSSYGHGHSYGGHGYSGGGHYGGHSYGGHSYGHASSHGCRY